MPAGRLDSPLNGEKKILLELAVNWASLSLHAYVFSQQNPVPLRQKVHFSLLLLLLTTENFGHFGFQQKRGF